MEGPPIVDGSVLVEGNRIVAVGSAAGILALAPSSPVLDLGEQVLLPGLINAHCHLDYTILRGAIVPQASFTAWVQRINALKRTLDSEDYLESIRRGFAELKRWGTTTVCNIESFPELMPRLPPDPIRTWWFYEMIDIRHRITSEEVVAGALSFFQNRAHTLGGYGLSPHAPYTASAQLYELANACAEADDMPLTTHLAESSEEFAMFRHGAGALHDFMASLKRPMGDCGRKTPFQLLWQRGAIHSQWILTHMNELNEEDFQLLESLPAGAGPHIVHCPGSHRYFDHSPFAFARLHRMGINLCVGTDSLASTNSLSLLRELRLLREQYPELDAHTLLQTITVNPARALKRSRELGRIGAGALADLIALPVDASRELTADAPGLYEQILACDKPVSWMMIDGLPVD